VGVVAGAHRAAGVSVRPPHPHLVGGHGGGDGHNVSDQGTITVQANTLTMVGAGLNVAASFSAVLGRDPQARSDLRIAFFANQNKRYCG
jgi:hypothetical protein